MPFKYKNSKGQEYYLHGRTTPTSGGKERTLYFFARDEREGVLDQVPDGYEVSESRTGLPVLKKKAKR
jgi:hypothetical protein